MIVRFARALLALLPLWASGAAPALAQADTELVYVGTQGSGPGQGIFAARLDTRTGKLTPIGLVAEASRTLWLVSRPDLPILYATAEIGTVAAPAGGVIAFRVDRSTGHLTPIGTVGSGGGGATYLALDGSSSTLLAANYATGQVAALPILRDGTLAPPVSVQSDVGTGPNARQKGPHAHMVALDPSRRFALVPDLGADRLFVYRFDRASHRLAPADPAFEATPPGTGPRHIAFLPHSGFFFLLTELVPELRAYRWDSHVGHLDLIGTTPTVDASRRDANKGAELAASPDGRFLYLSNRGEDTIVCYRVDRRTGALREVQRIPSGGKTPWSFAIDQSGRWLLAANQGSDAVTVFSRDRSTGRLKLTDQTVTAPKPVSVIFVDS
jgi:6-phosphogluconolactonase